MKKLLLAVLTLLTISATAQNYSGSCTVDRFDYLYAYAQPRGAGLELGLWPQDVLIGGSFGLAFQSNQRSVVKSQETVTETFISQTIYVKGAARVNRYVYVTGAVGVYELDAFYTGVGIRFSAPVGRGNLCSVIVEPQYTTNGFNAYGGLGVAFNP